MGVRGLTELCLLSPLGSKLRSGRPTFAWTTVAGADAYRIVVKEPSGTVALERRLTQARLPYPSDLPALRPGVLYSWSVEALAGDQPVAQAGSRFGVLAPESLARLRQEETALRSVAEAEIGDTTGPILLSRLYQEHGLAGDAIQQLSERLPWRRRSHHCTRNWESSAAWLAGKRRHSATSSGGEPSAIERARRPSLERCARPNGSKVRRASLRQCALESERPAFASREGAGRVLRITGVWIRRLRGRNSECRTRLGSGGRIVDHPPSHRLRQSGTGTRPRVG